MAKKRPRVQETGAKADQLAQATRARGSSTEENRELAKRTAKYGKYEHVPQRRPDKGKGKGKTSTPRWITASRGITSVVVNAVGHGKRR